MGRSAGGGRRRAGRALRVAAKGAPLAHQRRSPGRQATYRGDAYGAFAWAAYVAEVEVDLRTCATRVIDFVAVQEVGKVLNPTLAKGQVQGGVVQGIGWALWEEYTYDESGRLRNPTLLDYRMPTALDTPLIETIIVEVPNPGHPYGVRGVGEVPIVPPPAAIANAIHDAIGVRLRELPMNPSKVCAAVLGRE